MPKKFNKPLHNTLRPVSYNLTLLSQAGLAGSSLKAALNKFLL